MPVQVDENLAFFIGHESFTCRVSSIESVSQNCGQRESSKVIALVINLNTVAHPIVSVVLHCIELCWERISCIANMVVRYYQNDLIIMDASLSKVLIKDECIY